MLFTFDVSNSFFRVSIPLKNDDVYELTEMFSVNLNFPSSVSQAPRTTIDPANSNITIVDDDSMLLLIIEVKLEHVFQ